MLRWLAFAILLAAAIPICHFMRLLLSLHDIETRIKTMDALNAKARLDRAEVSIEIMEMQDVISNVATAVSDIQEHLFAEEETDNNAHS